MSKLAIGTFLLFLSSFTVMGLTIAQAPITVGVSQGDVFEYNIQAFWSSVFTATPPAELVQLNQTEWLRVTITEVSGSQIRTRITTHYKNGTEVNSDGFCDIDTGENVGGPPFISAGLGRNDVINPSAPEPWFVNATIIRDYVNDQRETNHLKIESIQNSSEVGEFKNVYEYYFDKNTGVLVEYSTEFSYSGLTNITRSKIISSNVWVIPEFPAFIILTVFMIMTLFAVAMKKRLVHRPP